jgi:ribosomal protein S18 acetylase RimI-like enzyme
MSTNAEDPEVVVRPLAEADFPRWSDLWEGYLRFYNTILGSDLARATFARLVSPEEQRFCGLGAYGPELIGLAHLVFHPTTWSTDDECYLEDLFVDPAARRSGVGRQLLDSCTALAVGHGAHRLYWHTQATNTVARGLYEQVGELSTFVMYEVSLPRDSAPE